MPVRDLLNAASGVSGGKTYIEDVFSTYIYTGNGSTQTITNGINLSGKGGLVWVKTRSNAGSAHVLSDTVRGLPSVLSTNNTNVADTAAPGYDISAFNSNGFNVTAGNYDVNINNSTYASWTFREASKFFDIVTYTGNGVSGRSIAHNLGVAPGMVVVKCTSTTGNWKVLHRYNNSTLLLNSTDEADGSAALTGGYLGTTGTTSFQTYAFGGSQADVNANGVNYVAYLFAHDTATDGLIQCGSYTTDSAAVGTVDLGWQPQYLLVKSASSSSNWVILDTMRGFPAAGTDGYGNAARLYPNLSSAEAGGWDFRLTTTGFVDGGNIIANGTVIYMAIRRGPMKTPTDGTTVFSIPATYAGNSTTNTISTGNNAIDMFWSRANGNWYTLLFDRLRGTPFLALGRTDYENQFGSSPLTSYNENTITANGNVGSGGLNFSGETTYHNYYFNRAPGFFDVVCYTGTGSATTFHHNLGVVPELMIMKQRNSAGDWHVYVASIGNTKELIFNRNWDAALNSESWNNTSPTSTVFTVGIGTEVNGSGSSYVAHLFASCPGVSKVGSYTGNGSSQTINCGFTGGARFIMIKRTDSTGNWYYWDTTTGITTGSEQYFIENTSYNDPTNNVIQTANDTIDPDSSGFTVNQVTATSVNVNAANYIYLAIA